MDGRSRRRADLAGRRKGGAIADATVLYDRDCGFCRWSLAALLALDRDRRLRPVALGGAEADRLLADMSEQARWASAHLVTAEGRVFSGGAAVAPILALLPAGTPASRVAGLVPGAWVRGYGWVARHRGVLGRMLPDGAKRRATLRIDSHARS
jgi:predicted DCC family thiol-disulfide oxidoreductase YuxK